MEWAASHGVNMQSQARSSSPHVKNEMHWNYAKGHTVKGSQLAVDFWSTICWSVVFSLRALKAKRECRFVLCHYYVLVLNVKGNICLQCEDTEALFRTRRAEAGSGCLFFFFFKAGENTSHLLSRLFWLPFFALILKTVSMLVIETILIYLLYSNFYVLLKC